MYLHHNGRLVHTEFIWLFIIHISIFLTNLILHEKEINFIIALDQF